MVALPTLVPKLLILGLGAATLWQVHVFRLACASTRWRLTQGLVLKAYFDERHVDSDGSSDNGEGDTFSANVQYRYVVAGKTFESTRLWYRATWLPSLSDAVAVLRDIQAGRPVDVYYDPDDHARSVLVTGSDTDNIVGIVMCIAGWITLVYFLH